jgi:lipid II:glycine glycyltransferase (peptidoglycan interpeptide bridge formation enzyme)
MTEALIQEYVRRRRHLLRIIPSLFRQDPAATALGQTWIELGLRLEPTTAAYRTLRVDLEPPLETLRKQLDQKWRNQLNAAERNGLTVTEGTGEELYAQFLDLYQEMMARKQFETTVDAHEFRQIQQRLPDPQKMLILISSKNGIPQTGLVATTIGHTGIYLLGATSNDGMKSKGSYLLQWHMLQRLKERGSRYYDLGGINPDTNPGVYHFKQGLSGEDVTGLGRFELQSDALSAVAVTAGERIKSFIASFPR